jgi:DNA-binding SARP family transcriptional activator
MISHEATLVRGGRGRDFAVPQPGTFGLELQVSLLGGFELRIDGALHALPLPAQRLVAFLALQDRPVLRSYVAGKLWTHSSEEHAFGSLRSAMWRLRHGGVDLIDSRGGRVSLAAEVTVDARVMSRWARTALETPERVGDGLRPVSSLGETILGELLPDWYDDWLIVERERLRELRVRGLERVCERLTAIGHFNEAIEAGLSAVSAEPLRESAHRCVIAVHRAEGNQAAALHAYHVYRNLLRDQLGLAPSGRMHELVDDLLVAIPA